MQSTVKPLVITVELNPRQVVQLVEDALDNALSYGSDTWELAGTSLEDMANEVANDEAFRAILADEIDTCVSDALDSVYLSERKVTSCKLVHQFTKELDKMEAIFEELEQNDAVQDAINLLRGKGYQVTHHK